MSNTKYESGQEQPLVVSEPVASYGTFYTPRYVSNNPHRVDYSTMPGIYTDEEFAEELRLSELEGAASDEEVREFFAKWGVVWRH